MAKGRAPTGFLPHALTLAGFLLTASVSLFAQGVVAFANAGPGLNAPVTNAVTGQRVDGGGFLAQLYGGAAEAGAGDLVALSRTTSFFSGAAAGYFDGGRATNPFVAPGMVGTFQVRAWSGPYSSYEAALLAAQFNPAILMGVSPVFQNATGAAGAEFLTGLESFVIAAVPEPRVVPLSLLGAGVMALWWRRRRG
jgi:hypothetical protein